MCVLFASNRPLERAENIKAVYDAYDGEKQYIRASRPEVDMHSGRYRVLVTDELMNDSPGKMLFIGHGCGAFKTYGLDMPGTWFHRPDLITYAIASSETMVPILAKQLGLSEDQMVPLGFPRMDAYLKRQPERPADPYWLYAPTFRRYWIGIDWDVIHKHMPEGRRLIVKPHMIQPQWFDRSHWQGIEAAPSSVPSTPYLMGMDALVTDYSSIIFDAMVLRKPCVLFAKDLETYQRERGIYYPYPESYSTMFCEREEDLIPMLQEAEWNDRCEEIRDFFVGSCDGNSVQKTIELIRSML